MNVKELNHNKKQVVSIDKSWEKYKKQPLFQDKVDKANVIHRTVGLPKEKSRLR